ncbi:MAG: hypothetical protein WCL51_07310 [Bacteroidota bacterium]
MNFFKMKTTWTNAELIPLKLAIATIYIVIGSVFHSIIHNYYMPILLVFAITVVWSVYIWIVKMKKENK